MPPEHAFDKADIPSVEWTTAKDGTKKVHPTAKDNTIATVAAKGGPFDQGIQKLGADMGVYFNIQPAYVDSGQCTYAPPPIANPFTPDPNLSVEPEGIDWSVLGV